MSELRSGICPEPVELNTSELDLVAGGQATAFVKQRNKAHISIGNNDSVTNTGGSVYAGNSNMAVNTQSNTNSGSAAATATTS
jgi:hypothetical protein